MPALSHLTFCRLTESNLYHANFPAAVAIEPALYRLLTFHVPNLMSLFHCLICTEVSVQAQDNCIRFVTRPVFRWGVVSTSPTSKLEDHHLSAVRDCLFNIFAATHHIGGHFSIRNLRTPHAVVTRTHLSWKIEGITRTKHAASPCCFGK